MFLDARPLKSQFLAKIAMATGLIFSRILAFSREICFVQWVPPEVALYWIIGFRVPNLLRRWFFDGGGVLDLRSVFVNLDSSEQSKRSLQSLRWHFWIGFIFGAISIILGSLIWGLPLSLAAAFGFYSFTLILNHFFLQRAQAQNGWLSIALWPLVFNIALMTALLALYLKKDSSVLFVSKTLAVSIVLAACLQVLLLVQRSDFFDFIQMLKSFQKITFLKKEAALKSFQHLFWEARFFLTVGAYSLFPVVYTLAWSKISLSLIGPLFWSEKFIEVPVGILGVSLLAPLMSKPLSDQKAIGQDLFSVLSVLVVATGSVSPLLAELFLGDGPHRDLKSSMSHALVLLAIASALMLLNRWLQMIEGELSARNFYQRLFQGVLFLAATLVIGFVEMSAVQYLQIVIGYFSFQLILFEKSVWKFLYPMAKEWIAESWLQILGLVVGGSAIRWAIELWNVGLSWPQSAALLILSGLLLLTPFTFKIRRYFQP